MYHMNKYVPIDVCYMRGFAVYYTHVSVSRIHEYEVNIQQCFAYFRFGGETSYVSLAWDVLLYTRKCISYSERFKHEHEVL